MKPESTPPFLSAHFVPRTRAVLASLDFGGHAEQARAVAETVADAAYAQLDAALAALEKGQARPSGVVK